ncbi:MAG: hypothetical protein V5804_11925 [Mucilaginibacter sp.]|uniref:hypothetical protein n=1 Tax=Mucilaginibacter sp. TaxID=1882438 RepID=UPI0034E49B05
MGKYFYRFWFEAFSAKGISKANTKNSTVKEAFGHKAAMPAGFTDFWYRKCNRPTKTNSMEVYFTSPTLGRIYGTVSTQNHQTYQFKGSQVLIGLTLNKTGLGWVCEKGQWLHDSQIQEIGVQIDEQEKWLSAR